MMMPVVDFLARHSATEHAYLAIVRDVLASGNCTVDPPSATIPCDQLLNIYQRRAAHLAQFSTPQGQDLHRDVLRFCEQLQSARAAEANWWTFRTEGGVHYNFVERSDTHELLGALKTVSKRDVSPDEWKQLREE